MVKWNIKEIIVMEADTTEILEDIGYWVALPCPKKNHYVWAFMFYLHSQN